MEATAISKTTSTRRKAEPMNAIEWAQLMRETQREAVDDKDWDYLASIAPATVVQEIATRYMGLLFSLVTPHPAPTPAALAVRREDARTKREADAKAAREAARTVAPRIAALFGPDYLMHDGRKLALWTWGELRAWNRGFTWLISHYASMPDDATLGATVRQKDWLAAAAAAS